jgi:Bacterial PH domain
MRAHRHTSGTEHEHEFEPQHGLPEVLPAGEHVLWQGQPEWRMLARKAFHVRKLVLYFAALIALRFFFSSSEGAGIVEALQSTLVLAALSVMAVGLITLMAWLSARGTVYTITDKRVVMRVGIVLTLTFNLPHKRIASAGLHRWPDGTGDLPLTLLGSDRIAFLNLWPHARPWRVSKPQPMLRGRRPRAGRPTRRRPNPHPSAPTGSSRSWPVASSSCISSPQEKIRWHTPRPRLTRFLVARFW